MKLLTSQVWNWQSGLIFGLPVLTIYHSPTVFGLRVSQWHFRVSLWPFFPHSILVHKMGDTPIIVFGHSYVKRLKYYVKDNNLGLFKEVGNVKFWGFSGAHVPTLIEKADQFEHVLKDSPVMGPGRYSDRSLFRQVDIPTGSESSIFRQTGRYSDEDLYHVYLKYQDCYCTC